MITASPYSEWGPAWITVPAAGDFTEVPPLAAMSRPEWNSGAFVHGLSRLPNSEFTAPRTGQRGGVANPLAHVPPVSDDDAETARDHNTSHEDGQRKPLRERETKDSSAVSSHHQQAELLLVVHPRGSPLGERTPQILRGF